MPDLSTKEQTELELQISAFFPEERRRLALSNLDYIVQVAYLRGQRDLLLDQVAKKGS